MILFPPENKTAVSSCEKILCTQHDLPFPVPLPASGKSLSPLAKQSSPSYKLFRFSYGVAGPLPQVKNLTQGRLSRAFYESPARLPFCLLTRKHAVDQSQRRSFLISYNLQHRNLLRDKLRAKVVIRATTLFNLQRNNVARQVVRKCCLYYLTLSTAAHQTIRNDDF